jgi:ecotin
LIKKIVYFTGLVVLGFFSITAANDGMKPFPPAEKGYVRYVIKLPSVQKPEKYKVQVLIGKNVRRDPSNQYRFHGEIKRETIKGWGYSYYILRKVGPMAGTLMAIPEGTPKVEQFIEVMPPLNLLRYNSRLPLVIYVPEGFEFRYRLWEADGEIKQGQIQ